MEKKPQKPTQTPTLKEISDYVKYALWGLAYFEDLRVEKIILGDEYVASVFYDGEHYALSFPKLQAVFNVQSQGNTIELDIRKLQVFEPDVEVAGRIIYSGASGQFSFGVSVAPLLIDSSGSKHDVVQASASKSTSKLFLQGTSDFKRLVLKAKTSKMSDLSAIRKLIAQNAKDLLPTLDMWLFNALGFETLEIDQASFDIVLHQKQFMKSLINNTKLTLYATKPTYKLDPTLAPFSANRAKIQVENGKAVLEMIAPKLESIDLNGSTLAFAFVDSVPTLSIFATSSKLLYTKALRDLLAFYGVQIPIDRISADMQANLSINIPFADNAPLKLGGKLAAQQAILSAGGLDFVSKGASIVIDINPKAGSNFIDIWTQNTSYENLFDIDTTMRIDLSQKLLKTSLFVHSLRVSTNPEINQRLINPQDKIRQPKKQAQSALKPLESSVSLESLRLSQAMPFTPQDMLAHIAHLASNAKLDSTQSLEESATQEQDLESPSTSEQELESSTPNTPEPAQDEVVDSSDASAPTTPLAKPDASLAPTEEIIDFSSREHEDDLQDQESAHKELETLESILQDTQEQKEQEKKEEQEGQDSSKAQQEPQESKSPQDFPTPQDKNLAQDESVDSSAPSEQEPQESKIESRKYTRNGVELDFSKPMGEKEMLEKIIALIKSQDEQKFTYDIFKATRETLPQVDVEIDFSSEPVRVSIPALDVYMQISSSGIRANVVDFSKFAPFSPIMKYLGLSSGSAVVELKGARDVAFQVRIADFPTFLLSKDKTLLHTFVFNGSYKDDKLEVLSDDGKIRLDLYDNTILANFTDIDVSIDGLLASKIPAIQEAFSTSSEKKAVFTREEILLESEFLRAKRRYERQNGIKPRIIAIQAQNITGFFKDVVIPFDDFNAKIRDDRISADATYKNGIANIDIIHGNTIIKAGNFSGEFLNRVVGRHIVDGGLFELSGIYKNDMFNGDVHIQNTSFKGFAIVQNVIGLIDTIPSLVMFRSPGLSAKGYEVKQGSIKLALNTQYVGLESIDLIGKSMDIQGSGFIELESQEVDMGLSISTLKNLSGILNKIPIVGYLLLGKDGKVTTQVSVRGTIQDPKTQISLAQDLLKTPLKVLKRAFTPVDIVIDEIVKSIDR
ncbi:AsmA-like C-terminal domain-containing protein [Helicobacter canis]|nr:AsmA-like C-terminal domain-containing protein [Helicobacter canis]